jgi:ankyrin repeat protein
MLFGSQSRMTPLFAAIREGDITAVTAQLQNPEVVAALNMTKVANRHVLHFAVEHTNSAAIITALVTAGADPNLQSLNKHTPLTFAIGAGNDAAIEILIALGAKVDAPGHMGLPPLAFAAMENNIPVMELLIAAGADVNRAGRHGATALEMAARHGQLAAVQLLMLRGAAITEGVVAAKGDMPPAVREFLDNQIRGRAANAKMAAIGRTQMELPEDVMRIVAYQASGVKKSPGGTYRKTHSGGRRRGRKTRRRRV